MSSRERTSRFFLDRVRFIRELVSGHSKTVLNVFFTPVSRYPVGLVVSRATEPREASGLPQICLNVGALDSKPSARARGRRQILIARSDFVDRMREAASSVGQIAKLFDSLGAATKCRQETSGTVRVFHALQRRFSWVGSVWVVFQAA